jgi:FkbM family methyltransferase
MLYRILSSLGKYIGKPPGYERFVRLFFPPQKIRGRPIQLLALRDEPLVLADPRTPLGWHLLFFGNYEPELRSFFRNLLQPGFVAVDVGANIGWHTLLMAQCVGAQGRIIAFEPNPWVRDRLVHHIALNRLQQVEVLPYALSDTAGLVKFVGPPAGDPRSGDGYLVPASGAGSTDCIEVEATPFDALLGRLALARLDLMKIDVEGFEWCVLRGCEQAIAKFRPHVVFEFNREYIARCNASSEQFSEFFRRHRYELFVATRSGLEALGPGKWPGSANLWAVPLP